MDALDLDAGEYDGTYKLVGGQSSLDLVNTVSWPRSDHPHDWLDGTANLMRWARAAGIPVPSSSVEEGCLSEVWAVRGDLAAVLVPLAHGEEVVDEALSNLSSMVAVAASRRRIVSDPYRWVWPEPRTCAELLDPVVWNAGHVVTSLDHDRLGHCPSCGWVFHDTTRNRSRRWCDMADCGSRDKALRYYHRAKGKP